MDTIFQLEVIANSLTFELIQVPLQNKISQDDKSTIDTLWQSYLK